MLRSRRRPNYGAQACALFSALLLLVSVSLLYTRLSLFSSHSHSHSHSRSHHHLRANVGVQDEDALLFHNSLVSDSEDDSSNSSSKEDKIDERDDTPEEDQNDAAVNSAFNEEEDNQEVDQEQEAESDRGSKFPSSGYYFDHINGVIRRTFSKRSIEEWDYDYAGFSVGLGGEDFDDKSKTAFGSDDIPVDEEVRRQMSDVSGIEDALLLKIGKKASPLRQGWGDWFDRKGDFLRRDRMFRSNLEVLNPMNNPLLQDPDGIGVTGFTRGDRAVQKWLLNEFKRVPFMAKKPLGVSEINRGASLRENDGGIKVGRRSNEKRAAEENVEVRNDGFRRPERKTLDNDLGIGLNNKRANNGHVELSNESESSNLMRNGIASKVLNTKKVNTDDRKSWANPEENLSNESRREDTRKDSSIAEKGEMGGLKNGNSEAHESTNEFSGHIYADGERWGYFPGLDPMLSFADFMDVFFRKGKCKMRVFMVWNSPPWMYSVRHQRGLESLLGHHRDACVVVFSETMELDFFKDSFVKDGYNVAVAMPNLDELLKNTPAHIFASVWFEWRKTKFYATHYSELVRLAVLYKYGGIYLDSDIIVLGSLSSLNNSVGMEGQLAGDSLNGAVMAFRRHSPFILECLREYYMTYDDTRLRWNGADLLTRVSRNFFNKRDMLWKRVVTKSYLNGIGINWSTVRNVMDMRSVYGGFAAAMKDLNVWVMNVVPIDSPDTLPIIYERGLFGIYHDWCESLSTYPRSYDVLHADHLFSKIKKRCNLVAVVAEVDRILRPEGKLIVRDNVETINELEAMARSMQWEVRMTYSKDKEGLLCVQKSMWRPTEYEALAYAL